MRPLPERDQHFMVDPGILDMMSDHAKGKTVLEVGGGSGNLTKYLAKKAEKVYVIEKDPRFEKELKKTGAEVIIGDAMEAKWPEADVMVSNPPYKLCEHLVYRLLRNDFETIVMTFPEKLFKSFGSTKPGVFYSSMFDTEVLMRVPKKAFSPAPKTGTVLLKMKRKISGTLLSKTLEQFDKKLKNGLKESFCFFGATKKEAAVAISRLNLEEDILEKKPISLTTTEIMGFVKSLEKLD